MPGQDSPISITVGNCKQLKEADSLLLRNDACREEPQLGLNFPTNGDIRQISLPLVDGRTVTIPTPTSPPTYWGWDLKLPPSAAPWGLYANNGILSFVVSSKNGTLNRLLADIHAVAPTVTPQADVKDPDGLHLYQQQTGILRSGIILGFILSLGCFFLTIMDLRWKSRRSLAVQRAIGASNKTLRVSAATQLGYPIALGGIASGVVGTLAGWSFLSLFGTQTMFNQAVPSWSFGLIGASVVVAIALGLAVGGGKFRLSALRDE